MKDAYSNSILLFQKYYQGLKCSKSFRLFLKKSYLYITYCFTNKEDKIGKSAKCSIGIPTSFNVSVYPKSGDCGIYLRLLMQFPCHFCFYTYIAEKKFIIKRNNNHSGGYYSKIFYKSFI